MTLPMSERQLVEVWSDGASRGMWTRVLEAAAAEGNDGNIAVAKRELETLPHPLVALEANADLVQQLTGCRWQVIWSAIEGGSSWEDVADALHTTVDEARASYTASLEQQEKYGLLRDQARARAVLDAGTTTAAVVTEDGAGSDRPALTPVTVLPLAEKDTLRGDVHSADTTPGGAP
ncbi:hypothetical protein AB0903_09205 [Streptomyces sp. NPDC048389]|uniref:hypothetical protein n=1 Tax=Streptomyces sp. NPDC048389 TaxID=3154622 RepID=UPI0034547592